jgi:hypothetical protein
VQYGSFCENGIPYANEIWLKTIQSTHSSPEDDLPNVKDGAGELLLVGEGELDGREGDVEALKETPLPECQHHRPVRVRGQARRDEAALHLVVDLIFHLQRIFLRCKIFVSFSSTAFKGTVPLDFGKISKKFREMAK